MSANPTVLFSGALGGLHNVKYAYLQAVQQDYGFNPLFVPHLPSDYNLLRGAGLPVASPKHDLEREIRNASAIVLEDFAHKGGFGNHSLAGKPIIQLWHGIPLKKIGFPEIESGVNMIPEKAQYLANQYSGYAAVPSTSPWMTQELFSKVFRAESFPELGFARNDILLRSPTRNDMLGVDAELYARLVRHRKNGGTVVVYMPTFRDTGGNFLNENAIVVREADAFCARHNILFLAKFHPNFRMESFSELPNFIVYDSQQDIYPVLRLADALLTDYSSIYFDYLLLDRPLLFYAYDKEHYLTRNRELFFDYESVTPGLHVASQAELFEALLRTLVHKEDAFATERRALCAQAFTHHDAQASHRLCCHIRDNFL